MKKTTNLVKLLMVVYLITILLGCSSSSSSPTSPTSTTTPTTPTTPTTNEFSDTLTISESNAYLLTKGDVYKKINLTLKMNAQKSIYFIFSNKNTTSSVSKDNISISSSNLTFSSSISSSMLNSVDNSIVRKFKHHPVLPPRAPQNSISVTAPKLVEINPDPTPPPVTNPDTASFYEGNRSFTATLKKTVISTTPVSKTLRIWVENACLTGTYTVTDAMVDSMANAFLKDGADNDIYDWVTNVCGEEWPSSGPVAAASDGYTYLDGGQPIDILLCDVDGDSVGTCCGYFNSNDNITNVEKSNQKIMFYMDAPIYVTSKEGGTWNLSGSNQKEQITTLAHEFQHMIFFYQMDIKNNLTQDTWINEMLAMSIEDLVAKKLYGDYSAAPYNSRFTDYNNNNDSTLCGDWKGTDVSYAMSYCLGSYLLRQYDGANFVKNIYGAKKLNTLAIESVTGLGFFTVMRNWGAAYLLSSDQTLGSSVSNVFKYNYDLSSTCGGNYEIGSINAYNNYGDINLYTKNDIKNVNPRANSYYKIADNLATGTYNISIIMNSADLELTVVAK